MEAYEIYRYQKVATGEFHWTLCRTQSALKSLRQATDEFDAIKDMNPDTKLRIVKVTTEVIMEQ